MQYVYVSALNPVCIVLIIPKGPSPQRSSPPILRPNLDIVNPGIMTIHRTWHTLININNMKFQPHCFRVCLIFYIRFCELQKASGITPWKKCYSLHCALSACLLRDVLNRRLLFELWPAAVAPKTITHHFFVSGIRRGKALSMQRVTAAQKMLLKRNPPNIRKWIAQFYYFRHLYSAGSACGITHNNCMGAHRYGQLYLHCSLICNFWVPSSCFCIVISLSLRVK